MLTTTTPCAELIKAANTIRVPCKEAIDWINDLRDATCADVAAMCLEEPWIHWAIFILGDQMEKKLRLLYLEKIKRPMPALQMKLKLECFDDEEKMLLESVYKGKLPNAEKQLENIFLRR